MPTTRCFYTPAQTDLLLVTTVLGLNVILVPAIFRDAGALGGLILMIAGLLLNLYAIYTQMHYAEKYREAMTLPDLCEAMGGRPLRYTCIAILMLWGFISSWTSAVFFVDILDDAFPVFVWWGTTIVVSVFMLSGIFVPMLRSELGWLIALAAFSTIIVATIMTIVLVYADRKTPHATAAPFEPIDVITRAVFSQSYPIALGMFYGLPGSIPAMRYSCFSPAEYFERHSLATTLVCMLLTVFGITSSATFGKSINANVLLSLDRNGPMEFAIMLWIINQLAMFPFSFRQIFIQLDIFSAQAMPEQFAARPYATCLLFRALYVVPIVVLTFAYRNFTFIVSLLGTLGTPLLAAFISAMLHMGAGQTASSITQLVLALFLIITAIYASAFNLSP